MKRSTGPRTTAKLSKSVSHQLNSYALAASAAGVSLLAFTPLAEGRIVYTKTDNVIDNRHVLYRLDLNRDKIVDFSIQLLHYEPIMGRRLVVTPHEQGNAVNAAATGNYNLALVLDSGARIGSSARFPSNASAIMVGGTNKTNQLFGFWVDVTNGYLGLKFQINGKIHYGWARLNTHSDWYALLTGYAYETTPNKPITAGKTKGPDVITVQPASLGHLAHGASAIPAWRAQASAH
jgi:hypothetical protein